MKIKDDRFQRVYCTNCTQWNGLLRYFLNKKKDIPNKCKTCYPYEPEDSIELVKRPNYKEVNTIYFNNKEERIKYFKENIKDEGVYALVTYNNQTQIIYIHRYEDFDEDGDYFLESPCELNIVENSYEIESYQCSPFLPEKIEKFKIIDERHCLKLLLNEKKKKDINI